jgi:hypothetical protein
MVKNSSQPNLNPISSLWQSLPLPQKNHLINVVAELVQRQLTKQQQIKGGCHERSLTPSHD